MNQGGLRDLANILQLSVGGKGFGAVWALVRVVRCIRCRDGTCGLDRVMRDSALARDIM